MGAGDFQVSLMDLHDMFNILRAEGADAVNVSWTVAGDGAGNLFVNATDYHERAGRAKNFRAAKLVILAADADSDEKVSRDELEALFNRLDANHDSYAALSEIEVLWSSL